MIIDCALLILHSTRFCGPIPVLLLRGGGGGGGGGGGTRMYSHKAQSSHSYITASLGQAVSAYNLKHSVWIVKA